MRPAFPRHAVDAITHNRCASVAFAVQLDAVLHLVLSEWEYYSVTEMRSICALLQTSSACRRAVQHATTAYCEAEFAVTELKKLAQFCAWLPQQPGLITDISISWCNGPAELTANWPVAEQLISAVVEQSLHASKDPSADPADRASSLCISYLAVPCPASPALFKALAAVSSLTSLNLACAPSQPTAAVCAALGRLRTIQELDLENAVLDLENAVTNEDSVNDEECSGMVSTKLALALQQLQQLTLLRLAPCVHPDLLQHLPSSVEELNLRIAVVPGAKFVPAHEVSQESPVCIDLCHLTRLTSLCLKTSVPLSGDSVLPKELITLTAHGPCNFHPGGKLTSLMVTAPQQSLGLMQHLPQLPQLRDVTVSMSKYYGEASEAEVFAVVAAVQHATQVTGLDWRFSGLNLSAEDDAVLASDLGIGSALAGLAQLQQLHVKHFHMPEAEVLKLTSLTSLIELNLSNCGEGVTDMAVVALACNLKELQALDLAACRSLSQAVMPALGSLKSLSRLDFACGPTMTDAGLQQLTTLTALQHLWIRELQNAPALSDGGKAALRAAMPQVRMILWN